MLTRIAVSIGDFNGIGAEIICKAFQSVNLQSITPIILSSAKVLDYYSDLAGTATRFREVQTVSDVKDGEVNVLNVLDDNLVNINPGKLDKDAGKYAMKSVERCVDLCINDTADAMVTAPISKKAVNLAGYRIPGHTEFLADKTDTRDYLMMMVHDKLRIGLVTTHLPLNQVVKQVSGQTITRTLRIMANSLANDFNIMNPRVAVLGLNPHAGDDGVIGSEEIDIIGPALEQVRDEHIQAEGPFPADGFFGNRQFLQFDGIIAMYHDQGLIPFKTLSFGSGVNFTAGLPFIRTSPDHGTAFDIAGKGQANPDSFNEALKLAADLATNRKALST